MRVVEMRLQAYRRACQCLAADPGHVRTVEEFARNYESITDDGDPGELRLCRAAQRRGR